MKRILFVTLVFLLAGVLFAQQGGTLPSSSQTRQTAQQYSTQAKSHSSDFESGLADLIARNAGNRDLETFTRLKTEIEQLETLISTEQNRVASVLDSGNKVPKASLDRIDRLIKQHQAKIAELDAFVSA